MESNDSNRNPQRKSTSMRFNLNEQIYSSLNKHSKGLNTERKTLMKISNNNPSSNLNMNLNQNSTLFLGNSNVYIPDEITTLSRQEENTSSFRQTLDQILNNGKLKKSIEIISFALSLFVFITYVFSTYYPMLSFHWFSISNMIVATLFNLETILYIYLAQHRLLYIIEMNTLISLFTSIFPYFAFIDDYVLTKFIETARALHIMRIMHFIDENLKINENDVVKHVVSMIISFTTMILIATCMFQIVERNHIEEMIINPNNRKYSLTYQTEFHDFLYYVVVTIATVGYGDIFPLTEQGRIVIILLIFAAAYLIPKETGKLLTLLENTSIYSREIYKSSLEIPHLVICCSITVDSLKNYCNELFHADHGQSEKNVIILNPTKPGQDMRLFLHAGKYEVNLRYLQGNPMYEADLERTDIGKAKAIVLMTDKHSDDRHSTDHKNIVIALSIKKYFLKKNIPNFPLYIQLIKPENKIHYQSGLESLSKGIKTSNEQMIIVEEIKMNLLSKSCIIPGIIPLITNLVRSSGSSDETEYAWLNEYLDGTGMEIYRAKLNEVYKNNTFAQISQKIFDKYDAIAFAMEIEIDGKTMITLNPGGFFIEKHLNTRKDVKFYIYLICTDKSVADRVELADLIEEMKESNYKKETQFQSYMRLNGNDLNQLDEVTSHKAMDEEEDYFFAQGSLCTQPDIKKDSIHNSAIFRDHIIVCGTHPSLYYYLLPLRAKFFGKENLKYVVILTTDMPKDLWDSISRFEKIILINGSPLCIEDLLRANIEYASKAVILENENSKQCSNEDKMIDSERVFIYKTIKKCNPKLQVMTELIYANNIEYLLPTEELNRLKPDNVVVESTTVFSSGEVFISTLLDTLTCQAYYNKHIVTIIHQLLTGGRSTNNSLIKYICERVGLKSSNLWQMDIPEAFIGKNFGELYKELTDNNLIALGLYRLPGARDNTTPYIYTKPGKMTMLTHRDKVFVLALDNIHTYFKDKSEKTNDIDKDTGNSNMKNRPTQNNDDLTTSISLNIPSVNSKTEYTPFSYVKEMIEEIEKQVDNLSNMVENTRNVLHESIASGVKQEISSLLQ